MLVLAKAMLSLMIGFILSIIAGLILVPMLKKKKARQNVSIFLKEKHKSKQGTPTMGGFIFIIPTILAIILLLLTNRIEFIICTVVFNDSLNNEIFLPAIVDLTIIL